MKNVTAVIEAPNEEYEIGAPESERIREQIRLSDPFVLHAKLRGGRGTTIDILIGSDGHYQVEISRAGYTHTLQSEVTR